MPIIIKGGSEEIQLSAEEGGYIKITLVNTKPPASELLDKIILGVALNLAGALIFALPKFF